jgi:hypothetical protein
VRFLLDANQSPLLGELLLRRQGQRRAVEVAALIVANLDQVAEDLDAGAVVVVEADRIRIRRLPIAS